MCTRYVLLEEHYRRVLERLGIPSPAAWTSRYNIGPGGTVPVIQTRGDAAAAEVVPLGWGWRPPWARDESEKLVNVRAETIRQREPLRKTLRARRCLVPATGFYEWQKLGTARQPFLFRRRDGEPFGLAAICPEPTGGAPAGLAVITTLPNRVVSPIHDRMPVTLSLEEMNDWLRAPVADEAPLLARLRPAADEEFTAVPVHRRMNNVRYEGPDCVAPIDLAASVERRDPRTPASTDDRQFELGL
jgi:putative SOS response-associated peptidase YedK